MENYINNIVADVQRYMKANPGVTPEEALCWLEEGVELSKFVDSRNYAKEAGDFVRNALLDDNLWLEACDVDSELYSNAILNTQWPVLDAALYCTVCRIRNDEIIARVKESSTTCRQLS